MSQLDDLETRLKDYVDMRFQQHKEEAFPDGETLPHRGYHERLIDDYADRKRFWNGVLENIVGGVAISAILAVVGFLGWAIMLWLREHLK